MSVYTGLRRADIINLEWKDINLRYFLVLQNLSDEQLRKAIHRLL